MRIFASLRRAPYARSELAYRTNKRWTFFAVVMCALLAACASEIGMQPAPLNASAQDKTNVVRLRAEVKGLSTAGYSRTLRTGPQWEMIGDIKQGQVLKPLDSVLTVEGANVREAYVVIDDGSWIGFWLPVERAFSPLRTPVAATFNEVRQ